MIDSNADLESELEKGPDAIKKALLAWRMARLTRERDEALIAAKIRLDNPDITSTEVKERIKASQARFDLMTTEVLAEAEYNRVLEKHLGNKRRAGLRTAY